MLHLCESWACLATIWLLVLRFVSAQKAGTISSIAASGCNKTTAVDECCVVCFSIGAVQLTEKNRVELVEKTPLKETENTLAVMVVLALGSKPR